MASQWGMTDKTFSNGAAYADLDNDGDLDLVVNNVNQPALIYKNNSREINQNHFIRIQLQGKDKNSKAIGSMVKIYTDSGLLIKELIPSRGFQSSVDYQLVFGLGKRKKIDSIVVHWPDQSRSALINPPMDTLLIIPSTGSGPAPETRQEIKTLFSIVTHPFLKHTEDDYVDFNSERNIPQFLSREGPRAAVADVNGDRMEDIYIGGTLQQPGQLYIQRKTGFTKVEGFDKMLTGFEDISAVFF